jgi:XRE family transcriptional regulator, regulator of sulfur utilization
MTQSEKKSDLIQLGKRIAKLRKNKGITLEKLAYEMDLSKGNLSDIEQGNRDPRYMTLRAIARGLNLSISKLLQNF